MNKLPNALPAREFLDECFQYDQGLGVLIWKERPKHHFSSLRGWLAANSRFAYSVVKGKSADENRYTTVRLNGKLYYAHRVIFKLIHNLEPEIIDHLDGNKSNNRPENLKASNNADNSRNSKISIANSSGCTGVTWSKQYKKWRAHIFVDGKQKHLGRFSNFDDAVNARKNAEAQHGFSEMHGRAKTKTKSGFKHGHL